MSIEIKVEQAYKGDCIHLRYGDKHKTNIIIDSGPGHFEKGFSDLICKIRDAGETVDLLILTHIDNDHIMGFKRYISKGKSDTNLIKKIWLNGEGVKFYSKNQTHSARNISNLVSEIKRKNIEIVTPIQEGYEEYLNGAHLKVITPKSEDILNVAQIIDRNKLNSSKRIINYPNLDEIINEDRYEKDSSDTNKASISFVFSYEDKKIAFLGDAHAEDVIEGKIKYFSGQDIDMVKISHHGSKYNTNCELLKNFGCSKFIISTKGPVDKETIARIIKNSSGAKVYCNYDWWTLKKYFSEEDENKYILNKNFIIEHKNLLTDEEDI